MSDCGAVDEPVHRGGESVEPVWLHQRRCLMEKNMSKTDDTSKLDHAKLENRVLADSELDAVTGGRLLEAATKGKVFKHVEIHGTA